VRQLSGGRAVAWIALDLARPRWRYVLAAFVANAICALFEGSTIGVLTIAIQLLGNPEVPLGTSLGAFGNWLEGARLVYGRELLFIGLVLFAIVAQVLRSGFQFTGDAATAHLQAWVQAEAHNRIFARIMRLPFSRVTSYRLGDLTDYLGQAGHLHDVIGRLNELARNALFVAIYGLLLFWFSWPMTMAVLATYLLVSRFLHWIITQVEQHASRFTAIAVTLSQSVTELLQAMRLIHTFAKQEGTIRTVDTLTRRGMASRRRAVVWSNVLEPMTDTLTVMGAGIFVLGGYLMLESRGAGTLPHLLAFLLALYRVTPRLRSVYSSLTALASLAPNAARMLEILRQEEDFKDAKEGRPFSGFSRSIEFREVTLRYLPDESPAVLDLSFEVPRGSFTALVGVSGTGKSTVADLLLRLFEPTSGQIFVDGVDLKMFNRVSWRSRLGVVSQDPMLFHASIRENIAFGKPDATMHEIVVAAKAGHADAFIARLANGYETVVGDRGHRLSGGQCQRVALARALVRQPEILILDEATSALDSNSERFIQQALDEQRGERTVLAIAHRLSTVARADQILVLAEGRLVERGTHQELLDLNGIYARLWRLQSQGRAEMPSPSPVNLRV